MILSGSGSTWFGGVPPVLRVLGSTGFKVLGCLGFQFARLSRENLVEPENSVEPALNLVEPGRTGYGARRQSWRSALRDRFWLHEALEVPRHQGDNDKEDRDCE